MKRTTWVLGALLLFSMAINAQQNNALRKANAPLKQALIQLRAKKFTAIMQDKLQLNIEQSVKIYTLRKQLSHYVNEEYFTYKNKPQKLAKAIKPHQEIFELGLKKTLSKEQYIAWNEYRNELINQYIKQQKEKEIIKPVLPKQAIQQPYIVAEHELK